MNSKDNLQRALKKAFEDHKEPLHEAQWDRLSAVLDKEKPNKKRFLPWFFISFGALLLAVAIGFYMGQNSPTTAMQQNAINTAAAQSQAAAEDTFNLSSQNNTNNITQNQTAEEAINTNPNKGSNTNQNSKGESDKMAENQTRLNAPNASDETSNLNQQSTTKDSKNVASRSGGDKTGQGNLASEANALNGGMAKRGLKKMDKPKSIAGKGSIESNGQKGNTGANNKSNLADAIQPNKETPTHSQSPISSGVNGIPLKPIANLAFHKDTTLLTVNPIAMAGDNGQNSKDSLKPNGGKKNGKRTDDNTLPKPKFAIGFSTGVGTTNIKVNGITNSNKIHRDAESLFDLTNANSRGQHFNFNFEWYPIQKFAIGFAAGLQYRNIVQTFDFSYKLNQLPFRDVNENILGYIFVPDSADPLVFHVQGRNELNYVNVPIRVMYTLPINAKNDLIFSGGVNASFMTKANGQTFSINTTQLTNLNGLYKNKFNVGLSLGLQYSYNVYKKWWLGTEFQFQQNKYNYSLDYGVLRSKIKITNYNLAVRYKF